LAGAPGPLRCVLSTFFLPHFFGKHILCHIVFVFVLIFVAIIIITIIIILIILIIIIIIVIIIIIIIIIVIILIVIIYIFPSKRPGGFLQCMAVFIFALSSYTAVFVQYQARITSHAVT